jgi:hypothetical protein
MSYVDYVPPPPPNPLKQKEAKKSDDHGEIRRKFERK